MIPFLHLGPLAIPTFGLMVATAMIAAYFVLRADFRRRGIAKGSESNLAELFIAIPSISGIVGARLYHVLESPRDLFADPWGQLFSRYGLAWFGGLIAGAVAWILLSRKYKIPLLLSLDIGSPAAALGYGIGRIGCLLSGDGDYGKPTHLPWPLGMTFPNGLVPTTQSCIAQGRLSNCRVYPTPLLELATALLITGVLWRLGKKHVRYGVAHDGVLTNPGLVFALYLILSGTARFLVEFIRINPKALWGMTNAQVASLSSVGVGLTLLFLVTRQRNDQPAHRT